MGGLGQTDGHHAGQSDVTVQHHHRDIIEGTDDVALPVPVARVDLDIGEGEMCG